MDSLAAELRTVLDESERPSATRISPRRSVVPGTKSPSRAALPDLEREIGRVDRALVGILRRLVAGLAPWPLFLHGRAGTGKTMAALCLLDHCGDQQTLQHSPDTRYLTTPELCRMLAKADHGGVMLPCRCHYLSPESLWERLAGERITVLDEIGARAVVSDHHYESLKRYTDCRDFKPAVYISNLSPERLVEIYDDRVASRLCAGTVFEAGGIDRRSL